MRKDDAQELFAAAMSRHGATPVHALHKEALQLLIQGKADLAINKLYSILFDPPHDSRIAVDLLRILLLEHRFDEAEQLTCKLPVQLLEDGQLDTLRTHVELIAASNPAENKIPRLMMNYYMSLEENPDQLEKRLKLASILLKIDDIESALEQLYAIRQADRTFRDDIGQRGMLALFSMLGDDDELVDKYRSRIS
mgnify:FL=1|jgi:thioredoxin-like negative regulator of GroEL